MDAKQNKSLISIGIPTYNNAEGLRQTLQYMACQTYKEIEIIISDNCSPDEKIQEIVQEFLEKKLPIRYYRQDENIGPVLNFEFVLKKAFGKYFMWAADDDKWEKNFIETGISALQNNNFYQAWFCSFSSMDRQGHVIQQVTNYSSLTSTPDRRKNIVNYLRAYDIPGKDCMTYAIYERLALIDTVEHYVLGDRKNHHGYNSAFNIAFLSKYNIIITDEILYYKTCKRKPDRERKDEEVVFKGNSPYRGEDPSRNTFNPKKVVSVLCEHYNAVKGTPYTGIVVFTIISILPCAIKDYLVIRFHRKINSVTKRIKALFGHRKRT